MERFYLNLSKYFISLLTCAIFLMALSVVLKDQLPQDFLPEMEVPKLSILINCPNCSNREIEDNIVTPLRNQLILVDGLKHINAESIKGKGIIELEFFYGQSMERKTYLINEIIDRTQDNFPLHAQRPVVYPYSLNNIPVVLLAVKVKIKDVNLQSSIDQIKRALESLNTVSFTDDMGKALKQIIVNPNYERLDHLGISSNYLLNTLKKFASNTPSEFEIQEGNQELNIKVIDTLSSLKEIEFDWNNQSLPLHQLANVKDEIYFDKGRFFLNGEPTILFSIYKQPHHSYHKFHNEVNQMISELSSNLPLFQFYILKNNAEIVQNSIKGLQSSFLTGLILIIGLVFIFYRSALPTILASLTLILTLCSLIVIFYILRISINLISIAAVIIALGIVIDNAIVVVDNLKLIKRKNDFRAIGYRTLQILPALITGNLTTLVIFVPLLFLPNLSGQLLQYFGFILALGLLTGLFISVLFIPIFFNRFFSAIPKTTLATKWTDRYLNIHKIMLQKNTYWIVISILILCIGIFCFPKLSKDLIPALQLEETSLFFPFSKFPDLNLKAPNLNILKKWISESSCANWSLRSTKGGAFDKWTKSQEGGWILTLSNCNPHALNTFTNNLLTNKGAQKIPDHPFQLLFSQNEQTFELRIPPDNLTLLSDFDISPPPKTTTTKIFPRQFQILKTKTEPDKVNDIIESLKDHLIIPDKYLGNNILIKGRERVLQKIMVENKLKNYIPLSELTRTVEDTLPKRIYSDKNGELLRIILPIKHFQRTVNRLKSTDFSNYSIKGLSELKKEQHLDFLKIGLTTVFTLLFMLFLHFQSWKLSFLVLLEIPFSLIGSVIFLYVFNAGLNLMSLAGMTISLGIVVNDSILKIDRIRQLLKKNNCNLKEAVFIAGHQRFLPIILTSLSTVLAVIPIFLGNSIGNQLQTPFALSIVGGMFISTFTSLFLLPKWILWLKL